MQRGRHGPDHVIADEDREGKNREPEHEWIDRSARGGVAGGRELIAIGMSRLGGVTRGVRGSPKFFNCGVEIVHPALR